MILNLRAKAFVSPPQKGIFTAEAAEFFAESAK
jgi:hypothetical protein